MEEKVTEEYFFKLLDEAEAYIAGDLLMETHGHFDYEIKSGEPAGNTVDDISSCHKCDGCFSRTVYAEPLLGKNPVILFILPSPEGVTMLTGPSFDYFRKWVKAMGLELSAVALTALIKCPVGNFSAAAASSCSDYLRAEMKSLSPRAIVLLGKDTAAYMLRKKHDFDALRLNTFRINGIKTYVTYSPADLVRDRSLRAPIWEDLKYIMEGIKA